MKLNQQELNNTKQWTDAGYSLPTFDREAISANTTDAPKWVHFGGGNIFRAFIANVQQSLLNAGEDNTGIIVAEGFDYEIVERVYRPQDNLSILVTLMPDGSLTKGVVGSVTESLLMDPAYGDDWQRLVNIFTAPSLQMASFTITEKGYNLKNAAGDYFPPVAADLSDGPKNPQSYLGKLTALLFQRYQQGELPLALVSMDNCSHNGTRLHDAVLTYAQGWAEGTKVEAGFVDYLEDRTKIAFPWSMIDKITPGPDVTVLAELKAGGLEDADPILTAKHSAAAPFVNAEAPQYLVIEDAFPAGRPPLDKEGVIFTDKDTVDQVEKMKVCTCLNPLHSALAIFGCLLDYQSIAAEMKNPVLKKMVEIIGYREGLPVVVDPKIIDPKAFIDEVIGVRLPNPFIPDTPQRIATDTSQKLAIRFGETIKAYVASDELQVTDLKLIPLVLAGWCRYLMGVDDKGESFTPSPDPFLASAQENLAAVKLGDSRDFHQELAPLLSNATLFGVDLYSVGLGEQVEALFTELVAGPGAVAATLEKYTA